MNLTKGCQNLLLCPAVKNGVTFLSVEGPVNRLILALQVFGPVFYHKSWVPTILSPLLGQKREGPLAHLFQIELRWQIRVKKGRS